MIVYQWILRNNQEICHNQFIITKKYFQNKEEAEKTLKDSCFSVVEPYLLSKHDGYMAEKLYYREEK